MYINGMVAEAAVKALDGKTDDKEALIKAMRAVSLQDSPRGPFHFDHFGNVVGNVYIRRVVKQDGKLAQHTIKTYPECQPVLDLRREVVPGAAGLFARLSAAEELMLMLPYTSPAARERSRREASRVRAIGSATRRRRVRRAAPLTLGAHVRSTSSRVAGEVVTELTMWTILAINSVTLGGLLFLLSAGFSLIFGLMRIPNLTHGSMFMLGAYFGVTLHRLGLQLLARGPGRRTGRRTVRRPSSSASCCAAWSAPNWRRCWSRSACRSWSPTPA